jgi:hypothetical protein
LETREPVSGSVVVFTGHFAYRYVWLCRQCYEKVFYFLLDRHRKKRLEDYNEPVGDVPAVRVRKCYRLQGRSVIIRAHCRDNLQEGSLARTQPVTSSVDNRTVQTPPTLLSVTLERVHDQEMGSRG